MNKLRYLPKVTFQKPLHSYTKVNSKYPKVTVHIINLLITKKKKIIIWNPR